MPVSPPRLTVTRRRIGAGVALALPALLARPARASRTVTFMGFGGWFQTAFETTLLPAFQRTHPDIGIFFYPAGNASQMLGLLRGQRSLPSTDVVLLDTAAAARATSEGLLAPIGVDTMPVIKDLLPEAVMPGLAGPALMLDSLALGYNPTLIPQAPRFWRNLWDAGYGRRIALQTPPDPAALAMTTVAATLFGGGDLVRSLDVGITAIAQLQPRVVLWDPAPDIYTAIALEDAGIGPGWNARAQNQAAQTPTRFAATVPNEGSPVRVITVNLVKGAPQPEAATLLINWLLGPEAQRLLAEVLFFAPVNARADIPVAVLERVGASPAMAARRMKMDWVAVDAIRDQITVEWRKRNLARR
ncbi:MAG: putative spermidine/putrescine transport system substrate-binding protein [Acetobacteraceae bacterium]|nr:putative spermidine/putrescine transport system substrate-binding protein [Acetobacteraceae bacterium]